MSENEQKAGCVDDAAVERALDAFRKCPRFCDLTKMRAALEAAALSPVPSGPWAVWWQGSGPQRGDHLMLKTESGLGYAEEIAYIGDQHHDAAHAIVNAHNIAIAALSPARSGEAVRDALVGVVNWYAEEEGNRFVTPPAICAALDALKTAPRNESSGVSPGGAKWDGKTYNRCLACGRASGEPCGGIDGNGLGCTNRTPAPQDSVRVGDGLDAAIRDVLPPELRTTPAPAAGADGGLPFTDAVINKMQDVMAVHGFAVPVRVISDAYRTTKLWLSDGAGQSAGGGE